MRFAMAGLAMAMAPLAALASSSDIEAPVNTATTTSVLSTVNASISLSSVANITTLQTDVTHFNATASASWNATRASNNSSSSANATTELSLGNFSISEYATAIAELVANAAEALENVTLLQLVSDNEAVATPEFDLSNFTTDELVQLVDLASVASLELGLSNLVDEIANATALSTSAQFDDETITFASLTNISANASLIMLNVSAQPNAALNASSADNSETITFLSVQNTSIVLQGGQVPELTTSSASSSASGAVAPQVQESPAAIEVETLEQTPVQVVSHSLKDAITRTFTAIEEAARVASQLTGATPTPSASTGSASLATKSFTTTASAADSENTATTSTGSEWVPTVAAVGAVVAILAAALFGYQRRSMSGYNMLSPGSAALSALTPPRALNV